MSANSNLESNEGDEAYAEGTALTKLLGDGPKVKILSAFLADPDWDHNITEIANNIVVYPNVNNLHIGWVAVLIC